MSSCTNSLGIDIFLVQVRLRTEVLRTPKFDPTGIRTHDLQPPDHDSTFHVTETPALTTRPSVTSTVF